MPGKTAAINTMGATTLAPSLASSWAMVRSTIGTMLPGPVSTALLTSRSMPPHRSITSDTDRRRPGWSCRSATMGRARPPASSTWAAVDSRLPGSRRPDPGVRVIAPLPFPPGPAGEGHVPTRPGQGDGGGPTDPAGGTGDHGPAPPGELSHLCGSTSTGRPGWIRPWLAAARMARTGSRRDASPRWPR